MKLLTIVGSFVFLFGWLVGGCADRLATSSRCFDQSAVICEAGTCRRPHGAELC